MGGGVTSTTPPGCWIDWIQLCYPNRFGSIWEYQEAFFLEEIDFLSVLGPVCPVCGVSCGFRRIVDYDRPVVELFPYKEDRVWVARFQCLGTPGRWPTFSLLPYQLLPYHKVTLASMVQALLMWREFWREERHQGTAYEVEQELPGEAGVTSWLLRRWAAVFGVWLWRSREALKGEVMLDVTAFSQRPPEILDGLHTCFGAMCRGSPASGDGVLRFVFAHAETTRGFLLGTPSQGRTGASSSSKTR